MQQKSILATCNYAARARGVKKLMLVSEALRVCPDLALRNGEDLAPFRAASRRLWSALRSWVNCGSGSSTDPSSGPAGIAWHAPVERLGLDEVFVDVTAVVDYNMPLLNRNDLRHSYFQLDPGDPEKGFAFDATAFSGCVWPPPPRRPHPDGEAGEDESGEDGVAADSAEHQLDVDNPAHARLMLASHLAGHLRTRLESEFGYTSSGGVSTNKELAKLAGSANKPRNQTTLLPGHSAVQAFLGPLSIRKIPGVGSRIAGLIEEHMQRHTSGGGNNEQKTESEKKKKQDERQNGTELTVRNVLQHPAISAGAAALSRALDRPGLERGSGARVWGLLRGIDPSPVRDTPAVPSQLSVEDTYMARPLRTTAEVLRALGTLTASLVARMRAELLVTIPASMDRDDGGSSGNDGTRLKSPEEQRWLARPRTIRLSTRTHPRSNSNSNGNAAFARNTRSQPLPSFIFDLSPAPAEIGDRLVQACLQPLFRRLHAGGTPAGPAGWNLALLNIGVTNMVVVAGAGADWQGSGGGGGGTGNGTGLGVAAGARDISRMFRTQEQKLRQWTVYDTGSDGDAVCGDGEDGAGAGLEMNPEPAQQQQQQAPMPPDSMECGDLIAASTSLTADEVWEDEEVEDDVPMSMPGGGGGTQDKCPLCGCVLPAFAMGAHERFHAMGG